MAAPATPQPAAAPSAADDGVGAPPTVPPAPLFTDTTSVPAPVFPCRVLVPAPKVNEGGDGPTADEAAGAAAGHENGGMKPKGVLAGNPCLQLAANVSASTAGDTEATSCSGGEGNAGPGDPQPPGLSAAADQPTAANNDTGLTVCVDFFLEPRPGLPPSEDEEEEGSTSEGQRKASPAAATEETRVGSGSAAGSGGGHADEAGSVRSGKSLQSVAQSVMQLAGLRLPDLPEALLLASDVLAVTLRPTPSLTKQSLAVTLVGEGDVIEVIFSLDNVQVAPSTWHAMAVAVDCTNSDVSVVVDGTPLEPRTPTPSVDLGALGWTPRAPELVEGGLEVMSGAHFGAGVSGLVVYAAPLDVDTMCRLAGGYAAWRQIEAAALELEKAALRRWQEENPEPEMTEEEAARLAEEAEEKAKAAKKGGKKDRPVVDEAPKPQPPEVRHGFTRVSWRTLTTTSGRVEFGGVALPARLEPGDYYLRVDDITPDPFVGEDGATTLAPAPATEDGQPAPIAGFDGVPLTRLPPVRVPLTVLPAPDPEA